MRHSVIISDLLHFAKRFFQQKRLIFYSSFFLYFSCAAASFSYGQVTPFRMKDIPLSWSDFSIKSLKSVAIPSAKTTIDFGIKWHLVQKSPHTALLTIQLSSIFNPSESFVSRSFLQSADSAEQRALLNHEKGHWIISSVYLKRLENTLNNFHFSHQVKHEIDSISKVNNSQKDSLQLQYDFVTDHSRNKAAQLQWEKKLLQDLNACFRTETLSINEKKVIQRMIQW